MEIERLRFTQEEQYSTTTSSFWRFTQVTYRLRSAQRALYIVPSADEVWQKLVRNVVIDRVRAFTSAASFDRPGKLLCWADSKKVYQPILKALSAVKIQRAQCPQKKMQIKCGRDDVWFHDSVFPRSNVFVVGRHGQRVIKVVWSYTKHVELSSSGRGARMSSKYHQWRNLFCGLSIQAPDLKLLAPIFYRSKIDQ